MRLDKLRLVGEFVVPRVNIRLMAVIACMAALPGCENIAEVGSEFNQSYKETLREFDKSFGKNEPVPVATIEEKKDEVVVLLNRRDAKRFQGRLAKLGFRPGPVDGILGSQTIRAMNRYQTAFGLTKSKHISSNLLSHLYAMSENGAEKKPEPTQLLSYSPEAPPSPVKLTAVDLPAYLPGTTFIYSNGDTERVLGAKDLVVRWGRSDGTTFSAHRNFLLPKSYWTSGKQRGTAKISGKPDKLWPHREGSAVSFEAKVTMQQGSDAGSTKRRTDQWRCQNNGTEQVSVDAGTFDTQVLVCSRGADPTSPEIVRTWYYAKDVGHYVRFVEVQPEIDTTESIDLVAIRPGALSWPPIVRAALTRALVHALEKAEETARLPWTSSGVKTRVTIKAKSKFVADDGKTCRRFTQIWLENGQQRNFPAIACKSPSGKWSIPGLESNTANSLATSGGLS